MKKSTKTKTANENLEENLRFVFNKYREERKAEGPADMETMRTELREMAKNLPPMAQGLIELGITRYLSLEVEPPVKGEMMSE